MAVIGLARPRQRARAGKITAPERGGDVLVGGETPQFGDDGAGAAGLERRGEPGDRGLAVGYTGVADPPRVPVAGGAVDDDGIAAAPALDAEPTDTFRGGHWLSSRGSYAVQAGHHERKSVASEWAARGHTSRYPSPSGTRKLPAPHFGYRRWWWWGRILWTQVPHVPVPAGARGMRAGTWPTPESGCSPAEIFAAWRSFRDGAGAAG